MRRVITSFLAAAGVVGILTSAHAQEPVLLRLDAPVGRVSTYRTQTRSWLPTFPTDSTKPTMVTAYVTTESVVGVDGDARIVSAVVTSSQFDYGRFHAKNRERGRTTVTRVDSRGRMLLIDLTRDGKSLQDEPGSERIPGESPTMPHAGGAFTLPEAPVRVGESWTATERVYLGTGTGGRHADVRVTYRLERIGPEGGARVAVISMAGPIVAWLYRSGTGDSLRLEAEPIGDAPATGAMSGEIHLDLDSTQIVSVTMNIEDRWGTPQGLRTRMTRTVL